MPTPTHKAGCKTLFFRPARCQGCDQIVHFWGCSCGSRVLFDSMEKPWPKHQCRGSAGQKGKSKSGKGSSESASKPNVKFINTYTYGVSSTVCLRCGKTVRRREMNAHNYYTHGIGKRPNPDPSKTAVPPQRPQPRHSSGKRKTYTFCPHCQANVLSNNLNKHIRKKCLKAPGGRRG